MKAVIEKVAVVRIPTGRAGESLYELALALGYVGTLEQFVAEQKGEDGAPSELRVDGGFLQWRVQGSGDAWTNLTPIVTGTDGREVEIGVTGTDIVWRYVGEGEWTPIVALADLAGQDGRPIEVQASATHLQYRLVGDADWINVVALSSLKGADGASPEMRVDSGNIQYRVGAGSWTTLLTVASITGSDGTDGNTVRSGEGAPDGGLGVDGDFYVDTVAWAIYGPKTGAWGSPTPLVGADGDSLTDADIAALVADVDSDTRDALLALAYAPGTPMNPLTSKTAPRNNDLAVCWWKYPGVEGVDDPDNWTDADRWTRL